MRKLILCLCFLAAAIAAALGQALVQSSATRLDATTNVAFSSNAVNTNPSLTINVPAGLYAYITGFSFDVTTDGTGQVINNMQFVSSGITGAPIWTASLSNASSTNHWDEMLPIPLKSSAAGTNV